MGILCGRMRRRTFISVLASWLCLLSFGLDLAFHAIRPFVCPHVATLGMETAFRSDNQRSFQGSAIDVSMPGEPRREGEPCDHRPSSEEHDEGHHLGTRPDPVNQGSLVPPLVAAALPPTDWKLPIEIGRARVEQRVRPPDAVHRLRTIVIII